MWRLVFVFLCLLLTEAKIQLFTKYFRYEPTWQSLDNRSLPQWYDDAKVGIFIHWGVFSVPSFGSEWFWKNWQDSHSPSYVEFMKKNYRPNFTYQDFAKDFTAEFYDPEKWVELFRNAGAKYIVLTSKHHEGYTLWPSRQSFSWNAMDVGPRRNLLGDLAQAVRNMTNMKFGVYHSLYEWFNPLYLRDKANLFRTNDFVRYKTIPELFDLVNVYKPDIIWSDGEWEAHSDYWNSREFLAWLYNDSPVRANVVVNDRWGSDSLCKHGGFFTCQDRFNPGFLQYHKWENCLTIDKRSWGFRRNAPLSDYMTIEELIRQLVETVSCGGNFLVNVGPTKEGIITPIYEERLLQMGSWLSINGEAIYYSRPWKIQNITTDIWFTQRSEYVYVITLKWPQDGLLTLRAVQLNPNSKINLLGYYGGELKVQQSNDSITIKFPDKIEVKSQWAYTLRVTSHNKKI